MISLIQEIGNRSQLPSLFEDSDGEIKVVLDRLGNDLEPSILIGGWATFIRIGGEISFDIDLITSKESRHKLEQVVSDLSASNNHQGRKLRATVDDVHLDIYLPFESKLGDKLRLRAEVLAEYADEDTFEKWKLLNLEAHIATKLAALLDRHFSLKGTKDAREVLALLKLDDVSPAIAAEVLTRASSLEASVLPNLISEAFDLIPATVPLSKLDKKLVLETKKAWINEIVKLQPAQQDRPSL